MAEKVREGDQEMSDVGGKVPGASVVGPASCPELDVNTAVNQGADKSTSSSQAPDDIAATSQSTDNATALDPLMDVTPLSRESTDVITAGHQLTDMERVADSRTDKESGENGQPDFSLLPLLVWVNICSMLNPRDRLVLSVMCRKLNGLCRDSSVLWRSVFILIEDYGVDEEVIKMKTTDRSILRAHCHQIEKLVIHIRCFVGWLLDESSDHVLSEAATTCQLKHLEIIDDLGIELCFGLKSNRLQNFLHTFVTSPNASQLCQLKIQAFDWSTHYKFSLKLIEALKCSSFTSSLTHLYLDMLLHCSSEVCQAIERFQNLQYLTVPFGCLSDSLLDHFSEHLKEVHFIVYKWDRPTDVTKWPQVLTRLPQLMLGLIFVGRPAIQIITSVRWHLPVSFIRSDDIFSICSYFHFTFLQRVSTSCAQLEVLQCRYNRQLGRKEYRCQHQMPRCHMENVLIKVVSQCPRLDHLVYSGSISSEAVLTLAAMRKWKVLQFRATYILCSHIPDREKNVQTLCEEVSRILGRTWKLRPHIIF